MKPGHLIRPLGETAGLCLVIAQIWKNLRAIQNFFDESRLRCIAASDAFILPSATALSLSGLVLECSLYAELSTRRLARPTRRRAVLAAARMLKWRNFRSSVLTGPLFLLS